jgi:hypothetical protein
MSEQGLPGILVEAHGLAPLIEKIDKASKLSALVLATLSLARTLAVMILEFELNRRAREPTKWPHCPSCGSKIESKGFRRRSVLTLAGVIGWKRRVGRCPKGCGNGQFVPYDDVLGITPYQQTSNELKRVACALAVFVPFEICAKLLEMITQVWVSPTSIWHWVQEAGHRAMKQLDHELEKFAAGEEPCQESMESELAALPLIMGADGVMAPFRPNGGAPSGKTDWREVKVGIFARLGKGITKAGKKVTRLKHRRVVAVLGTSEMLGERMLFGAIRQGIRTAKQVTWISDGGPWLWTIYKEHFARYATGVLDFYHAAQNIWKAAAACLDGTTEQAKAWFGQARHMLRHEKSDKVLRDIWGATKIKDLPESSRDALSKLYEYLDKHREHMDYRRLKELGLPIGSGMVESACKWLIQQRFKGVGMRWGEDGFNHLLHLRLAWVNSSFDNLFLESCSPNH